MTEDFRYPLGKFDWSVVPDVKLRRPAIAAIADLPVRMREAVEGLTDRQLDTAYRPNGLDRPSGRSPRGRQPH